MADPATIRSICERNVKMLSLRPERGHLRGSTRARVEDGLRCVIEDGGCTLSTDMPGKAGGENSAPTPGVLGRGALASCLAIGITMWAARMQIPLRSLEVEVLADFDARGELGVDRQVRAGYQHVRREIHIDSPASNDELLRLIEIAERHSPYLDVFGRAQDMGQALLINGKEVS